MTTPDVFYRVRITIPGALIHLAALHEPRVTTEDGHVTNVDADWIDELGDTIGYIDWTHVVAITWRRAASKERAKSSTSFDQDYDFT